MPEAVIRCPVGAPEFPHFRNSFHAKSGRMRVGACGHSRFWISQKAEDECRFFERLSARAFEGGMEEQRAVSRGEVLSGARDGLAA
jgi:hypothetical protein